MTKRFLAIVIIAALVLTLFPASLAAAASYPAVKAGKTTANVGESVKFSVVTSNQVVKIQTLIDGAKGSTYTKYTEKKGLRYWNTQVTFTNAGKRKIQYAAYKKSGSTVVIPGKPVYVNVKEVTTYEAQFPTGAVTGKSAAFTVVTPSTVVSLRYYIDGKAYSKTSKYASNSGGKKTWNLSMTFLAPGTRKIQFAAYSAKGATMKKFPSKAQSLTVKDGPPIIDAFKMPDREVVPVVEGNPKFIIDAFNQSDITVKIYNSDEKEVAALVSNKNFTGEKTYTWNILDKSKKLTVPVGNYTAKLHAVNDGGEKDISLNFSVKNLETPQIASESAFVVDFDIASIKATLKDDGNVSITDSGFYYGLAPDKLDKKVSYGKSYEGNSFRKLLSSLAGGTTYYFQAYAVNAGGRKGTGEVVSFATPAKGSWTVEDSFKKSVDEEYIYLFNSTTKKYTKYSPPIGYGCSSEAALYIKSVTVPIWKIVNGKYVQSTMKIRVHRKLVEPVKAIFNEIMALPKKFPIKSLSSFYYRTIKGPNASSSLSFHSYGCAIDINPSDNPHVRSGDPRKLTNPYRIPQEVVDIFRKYGWDWGGYFSSSKDYMHFEYLGTPLGKIEPPPEPSPSPSPTDSPSPSPTDSPSPSPTDTASPSPSTEPTQGD